MEIEIQNYKQLRNILTKYFKDMYNTEDVVVRSPMADLFGDANVKIDLKIIVDGREDRRATD